MKIDKQNVDELNQMDRRLSAQKQLKEAGNQALVAVSGGYQITLTELVGADLRPEWVYTNSPFANAADLLQQPDPECHYVWRVFDRSSRVRMDSMRSDSLYQGIRKGWYRPVQVSELREDVDVPYSATDLFHGKDPGNDEAVVLKGLVLIELTKQAYDYEYRQRVLQAAMNADPNVGLSILQNSMANLGVKSPESVTELRT